MPNLVQVNFLVGRHWNLFWCVLIRLILRLSRTSGDLPTNRGVISLKGVVEKMSDCFEAQESIPASEDWASEEEDYDCYYGEEDNDVSSLVEGKKGRELPGDVASWWTFV